MSEPTADYDAWERAKADPEVVAAHAALDAHEAEEDRLTLELGRALRRARARVTSPGECCCEASPPEFGGNLPDRECPLHGERVLPPAEGER